jgi:hypothetical protein
MSLRDFGNTATKLTHNPLGIIALFIVLVYAFASLVVGLGANLEQSQKTPLIWFLVLFPVLVLIVFAWLVSRHHMKLYAPTDYRDERLFVYPISPEDQRLRLQDEVDAIQSLETETADIREPEADKTETTPARLPVTDRSSAVSKYLIAEDLALRQLEADFGLPIEKHVVLASPNSRIMLDGLIRKGTELIAIEIKYVRNPHRQTAVIQEALYRFISLGSRVQSSTENSFRFIFVFVTEFTGEDLERFKAGISDRFANTPVPVEWRFFNFSELKNRFGVIEEQA